MVSPVITDVNVSIEPQVVYGPALRLVFPSTSSVYWRTDTRGLDLSNEPLQHMILYNMKQAIESECLYVDVIISSTL